MKYHVLHIARWYPNLTDKQIGSFVKKHIEAISLKNKSTLIYVQRDPLLQTAFKIEKQQQENFISYILYFRKTNFSILNLIRYFFYHFKLLKIVIKEQGKPNLVHLHAMYGMSLITYLLSQKLHVPFFITEHWNGFTNDKFSKKDFVFRWVTKYVSKKAKGITAVSSFLQKGLKENNISESIVVIPNVVEKFEGAPKLKFDNTKINILTIADLDDDVKNISAIITAFSNIKKEMTSNFVYHIVGHGKDELKLKHLVAEYKMEQQIIFYGLKENNEVLEFIASCDFVIINSRVETFSVVLAEAFMSGKPAIVTACGGTQEIFRPENGIMISIDDNEGLQNAIETMLIKYNDYNAETIMQTVGNKYQKDTISNQFQMLYDDALLQSNPNK